MPSLKFLRVGVVISAAAVIVVAGFSWSRHSWLRSADASTSTSTAQTVTLTVNETINLALSTSSLTLPSLTPGVSVTATSSATVTTNAASGWQLSVNRVSATSTIASGTIIFPDATAFNGSNATSSVSVGANLSFRENSAGTTGGLYNSSTWGIADTDPSAFYAGFPTSSKVYAATSTYSATPGIVVMELRANAPLTQVATAYSGSITVTALALP